MSAIAFIGIIWLIFSPAEAGERVVAFTPIPPEKRELIQHVLVGASAYQDLLDGTISWDKNIRYAEVSLKKYGEKQIFILIDSIKWCGTIGCSLTVWERRGDEWKAILETATDGGDCLRVQDTMDHGYHRLVERQAISIDDGRGHRKSVPKKPIHYWWDGVRYQDDDVDEHG